MHVRARVSQHVTCQHVCIGHLQSFMHTHACVVCLRVGVLDCQRPYMHICVRACMLTMLTKPFNWGQVSARYTSHISAKGQTLASPRVYKMQRYARALRKPLSTCTETILLRITEMQERRSWKSKFWRTNLLCKIDWEINVLVPEQQSGCSSIVHLPPACLLTNHEGLPGSKWKPRCVDRTHARRTTNGPGPAMHLMVERHQRGLMRRGRGNPTSEPIKTRLCHHVLHFPCFKRLDSWITWIAVLWVLLFVRQFSLSFCLCLSLFSLI